VLVFFDFLIKLGIATYYGYFGDNVDIHVIWGNFYEGMTASSYIIELIPKSFILLGLSVVVLQCYFASRLSPRIRDRLSVGLAFVVLPMFSFAVYKVPLRQAAIASDYTMCIKLHGYYTAMISDLLYTGVPPSEEELLKSFWQLQQRHPAEKFRLRILSPHPYESLMVIQVESLDYNILDYKVQGREVTPFLNRLKKESILAKLDSFHYGASGSSGADFQFLTGLLPLQNYPTFKILSMDYAGSLPSFYARRGISTLAFHGNVSSMWGRAWAYKEMGINRFFDAKDLGPTDTRWGVSDQLFFQKSKRIIEGNLGRGHMYFLITLSSHGPFDFVQNGVFAGSDMASRYFDSINYVDKALEQFLTLKGRYLVILYGDHSANVEDKSYSSRQGEKEFVPALIFFLEDGRASKPRVIGDASNLLTGTLDIRSLYHFAKEAYP